MGMVEVDVPDELIGCHPRVFPSHLCRTYCVQMPWRWMPGSRPSIRPPVPLAAAAGPAARRGPGGHRTKPEHLPYVGGEPGSKAAAGAGPPSNLDRCYWALVSQRKSLGYGFKVSLLITIQSELATEDALLQRERDWIVP